jgi:hypothetical protein
MLSISAKEGLPMKKRTMFSWGVVGRMNGRNAMKKCIFCSIVYFVVCFGGLGSLYWLVSLLIGGPAFYWVLFGWNHQTEHPMPYIGVVAVCYALVAALWTVCMKRPRRGVLRILEVLAVILVALALACPLGGMLWHFHDMLAGFFPNFWLRKLLGGFADGLMIGPRLIFYSFPYNLIGVIVGYFATTCLNSFFHQMNGEVKGKKRE